MRDIKFRAWDFSINKMWDWDIQLFAMTWIKHDKVYAVMQYTGLHDKNGVEIFEGDIVAYSDGSGGEVVFRRGAFTFNKSGIVSPLGNLHVYIDTEIIGNIYENGDLL